MASPLFILLVHKVGEMRNSMPSTLVCELFDDFVDSVKIGDTVKISGVFVARETRRNCRTKKLNSIFQKMLRVLHMNTEKEIQAVPQYIDPVPQSLEDLLHYVAPSILESNTLKMGFLLAIVGGMNRQKSEEEVQNMTPNERKLYKEHMIHRKKFQIHTLILGNPSTGKSILATWFENLDLLRLQNAHGLTSAGQGMKIEHHFVKF